MQIDVRTRAFGADVSLSYFAHNMFSLSTLSCLSNYTNYGLSEFSDNCYVCIHPLHNSLENITSLIGFVLANTARMDLFL